MESDGVQDGITRLQEYVQEEQIGQRQQDLLVVEAEDVICKADGRPLEDLRAQIADLAAR